MPSTVRSVGVQQNFNKIPVLGLVTEQAAAAPGTPVNGQSYYDTTLNRVRLRENGAWVNASQSGSVLTTDSAGGDITGVFSNLQIGTGAVGAAEVADGTLTDVEIAATNKDGAAGTASMRTLGTGATQASPGNRTLNQVPAPTADVALGGFKITGLAVGTAATDAVTKGQLDSVSAGLDPKGSVRAASTANVAGTYNATGGTAGRGQFTTMPNALDGVTLAPNDRVLLKNQSTGAQNGLWVVTTLGTGANGVWDRAADFDADAEVTAGAFTFVEEGTANDNTGWVLSTNNPITIGGAAGTALTWTQFSGGSALTAGAGLTQTGNTFDVVGTAARIIVNADSIDIASNYVGQASITTVGTLTSGALGAGFTAVAVAQGGTGATTVAGVKTALGFMTRYSETIAGAITAGTPITITHNLGTKSVMVAVYRTADDAEETIGVRAPTVNTVELSTDVNYAAGALRVEIIG